MPRPRQVGRKFRHGVDTPGEEGAGGLERSGSDIQGVFKPLRLPQGPAGESKPFETAHTGTVHLRSVEEASMPRSPGHAGRGVFGARASWAHIGHRGAGERLAHWHPESRLAGVALSLLHR